MLENKNSAGQMTVQLTRQHTAFLKSRLQPLGLSPAQYQALSVLEADSEQTQRSLAAALGVEQATMANTLARMERDGLIARKPHPDDGRAQLVVLTQKACDLVGPARQAAKDADQALLDGLPVAEQALFLSMLGRVISAMETAATIRTDRSRGG